MRLQLLRRWSFESFFMSKSFSCSKTPTQIDLAELDRSLICDAEVAYDLEEIDLSVEEAQFFGIRRKAFPCFLALGDSDELGFLFRLDFIVDMLVSRLSLLLLFLFLPRPSLYIASYCLVDAAAATFANTGDEYFSSPG